MLPGQQEVAVVMRKSRAVALMSAIGMTAALTACGTTSTQAKTASQSSTSQPATTTPGKASVTTVKVGILPIIDVAPMYLGIKQGIFAKYGLKVVPEKFQSGPAAIASLTSGSIQFGFSAPASEVQADAQGIGLEAIVGAISQGTGLSQALIVKKGSSIHNLAGLAGKTIAVSALHAVNEIVVQGLAAKSGMNPNGFHFIALPYPDMQSALASGSITAAYQIEPFLSAGVSAGDQVAVPNPQAKLVGASTEFSNYITSTKYASGHASIVKAFSEAMTAADNYANANTAAVRAILPSYTGVSAATAGSITLGQFDPSMDMSTFSVLGKYMKQFGVIKTVPNLTTLVVGKTTAAG